MQGTSESNQDIPPIVEPLPQVLRESVLCEISERASLPGEVRWLVALLTDDPLIPVPAAAAMVQRMAGSPLGLALSRLERDLDGLPGTPEGFLLGDRRCLAVALRDLRRRVDERLARLAATN